MSDEPEIIVVNNTIDSSIQTRLTAIEERLETIDSALRALPRLENFLSVQMVLTTDLKDRMDALMEGFAEASVAVAAPDDEPEPDPMARNPIPGPVAVPCQVCRHDPCQCYVTR